MRLAPGLSLFCGANGYLPFLALLMLFQLQVAAQEPVVKKKFLKAHSSLSLKNSFLRFVIVPDFGQVGGCEGFIRLLPQLMALRPTTILLGAEDVSRNENNEQFRSAIRTSSSKEPSPFLTILDRLATHDKLSGRINNPDGILRIGMMRIPRAGESHSHITLPWISKPSAQSVLGTALLAAGYAQLREHEIIFIKAMPADFERKELLVVDVYGPNKETQKGPVPATYPKGFGYLRGPLILNKDRNSVGDFDQ